MGRFEIKARDPLFFMHIPKTAGMSMRLYLSEQYQIHHICPFLRWHGLLGREHEVASFRLVQGHFRYNLRRLITENARMLVILREPLRRTVSALLHLQRDPSFHLDHQLAQGLTLSEMIRHAGLMRNQRDVQARYLCASMSSDRVGAYLATELSRNPNADAGDLEAPPDLELAMRRLGSIDFVGVTEDIGAVVSSMSQAMNYHPPLYFPIINENPAQGDPLPELTDEDLGILQEYNDIDLKIYHDAKQLIRRRTFTRDMQRLVDSGVYVVLPGSFEISVGDIMPGSGWYAPDKPSGASWRWTGPSRHFTIEVPLRNDTPYRLILGFTGDTPPGPDEILAEVNDVPVAFEPVQDQGWKRGLIIPVELLAETNGFCRIRFKTREPVKLSASDVRTLGVAVRQIVFECLDG
jgi:hypothetical protein